jgi:hypothetical protein
MDIRSGTARTAGSQVIETLNCRHANTFASETWRGTVANAVRFQQFRTIHAQGGLRLRNELGV